MNRFSLDPMAEIAPTMHFRGADGRKPNKSVRPAHAVYAC